MDVKTTPELRRTRETIMAGGQRVRLRPLRRSRNASSAQSITGEASHFEAGKHLNILKTWKDLSHQWKEVRRDFSETSVHDFRVNIRRMISALELVTSIRDAVEDQDAKVASLIRQLKRILKHFGPLRDIQVQFLRIVRLREENFWTRFSKFLKRREKTEVGSLEREIRERKRKSLQRRAIAINRRSQKVLQEMTETSYRTAVKQYVYKRYQSLMSAHSDYRQTSNFQNFHKVRIEFKRFRYAAEAAQNACRFYTDKQFDQMKDLQDIMGEIHDIETLLAELKDWASNRSKLEPAIVKTALSGLETKHNSLVSSFNNRPDMFENFALESRLH